MGGQFSGEKLVSFQAKKTNPSTTIKFSLVNNSDVTLKVYSLIGTEIATLINSKLNAGTYEFKWEPFKMASGVYYYKLEADGFIDTKRIVLIK